LRVIVNLLWGDAQDVVGKTTLQDPAVQGYGLGSGQEQFSDRPSGRAVDACGEVFLPITQRPALLLAVEVTNLVCDLCAADVTLQRVVADEYITDGGNLCLGHSQSPPGCCRGQ
jgi:hypothetical protein